MRCRSLSWLVLLSACVTEQAPDALAVDAAAPPTVVLSAPTYVVPGELTTVTVTGVGPFEPVYLGFGPNPARGPCLQSAGGLCLDIGRGVSLLDIQDADAAGVATISFTLPPNTPTGVTSGLQAVIIRGINGRFSAKSALAEIDVVTGIPGCTDPTALNFNPAATIDDGSCDYVDPTVPGYAGPAGPDLSGDQFTLCGGTSNPATPYTSFYDGCRGFDEIVLACSTDGNATAEFTSPPIRVNVDDMFDTVCDDFAGGANSTFSGGRILTWDPTNPGCGQYNVNYDFYMDMVSPQWGCNGVTNTHTTNGRMWMYGLANVVPGCIDPAANNFNPLANRDDGSCTYPGVLPGYVGGVLGPDLSAQGWSLCAGTDVAAWDTSTLYAPCEGFSEVRFACSVDANQTAEYVSPGFPLSPRVLSDGTCDDWTGGVNSIYPGGHIVSVDASDPTCGQYNVSYQLYADWVNGQWGCNGTINSHTTGGRMWIYVR